MLQKTLYVPWADELLEEIITVAWETPQLSLPKTLYALSESTFSVTETSSSLILVAAAIVGSTTSTLNAAAAGNVVSKTSSTMVWVEAAGIGASNSWAIASSSLWLTLAGEGIPAAEFSGSGSSSLHDHDGFSCTGTLRWQVYQGS